MLLIQLTGLSGAGKTSIANAVKTAMATNRNNISIEVVDADVYRKTLCKDLGFSKEDRIENIRRLGKIAGEFTAKGTITIVAAINPYTITRTELKNTYNAKIVWINCPFDELVKRDTKGLYRRALVNTNDYEKINNLTGVNDPYEVPEDADLVINTGTEDLQTSATRLNNFILQHLSLQS